MDAGEEVSGCLVVAGSNRSVLLELAEEIFHEMARFVHLLVETPFDLAITFRGNNGFFSCLEERLDHALVCVIRFVCQQSVCPHLRQKLIGAIQIMGLAWAQQEGERITQGIDHGVDFGAQSALAAPDRLVFARFFWAPALCWWARTMVLSIMAYSLSASAARSSNSFFHTPVLAQRENRV